MPFRLVQELEEHLEAIKALSEAGTGELEDLISKMRKMRGDNKAHEAEEKVREYINAVEDMYAKSAGTICSFLHAPIIYAIGARLVDGLLGPLQWIHTAGFLSIVAISIMITRKRPSSPITIEAFLSIMPRGISGSLTKLVGGFFCIYTVCPPFAMYAWQDISDRTQVRWILIGMLLNILYFFTVAFLGSVDFREPVSIAFALVGLLVEFKLLRLACEIIFASGPWDPYFKIMYVGDTGRVIQHPVSRVLTASVRYATQLVVFRLNLLIRNLLLFIKQSGSSAQTARIREANYKYSPIEGPRKIRLLRVHKGMPSETLKCSFETRQLEDEKAYEAISYVWGSPSSRAQIVLENCYFSITQSAFNIINKRRSMWLDKLIWIDQLCIDQKNDAEKASQVRLMGQIYQEAATVVAYLGESSNAHLVQTLMAELCFRMEGQGMTAQSMYRHYSQEAATSKLEAVAEFFGNDWFQRVWIIQEAVFANRLRLIYGDVCIDWKHLSRAMNVLGHQELLEAFAQRCTKRDIFLNFLLGIRNVDPVLELRGEFGNQKTQLDLAHVLTLCNGFKSTLKRDKIYAILDLTKDGSKELIKPTYEKVSDRDIYIDAMLVILKNNTHPLRTLVRAGIGFLKSSEMTDLPSWVPDWSHSTHFQIVDNNYSAGTSCKAGIKVISKTEGIISLDGMEFDQVEHITDPIGEMILDEPDLLVMGRYIAAERMAMAHVADPYGNGQPRLEAFIRTLVGNQVSLEDDSLSLPDQYIAHYVAAKQWYEVISGTEGRIFRSTFILGTNTHLNSQLFERLRKKLPEAAFVKRFLHFAGLASSMRRFCITKQGRMAIVPLKSLVEDVICVLKGARMPFVLSRASPVGESPEYYRLVGCCYVHGVMEAELDLAKSGPLFLL